MKTSTFYIHCRRSTILRSSGVSVSMISHRAGKWGQMTYQYTGDIKADDGKLL